MRAQKPVLDFSNNPDSALLGTRKVKLVVADLNIEGEAEAKLDLAPVPGLYLHCVFEDPRLLKGMISALTEPESLTLVDSENERIEGTSAGSKWSADGSVRLKWRLLAEPVKVVGDDDTQMTMVVAHVFNLETRLWKRSTGTAGVLQLSHKPWNARIRVVEGGYEHISELRTREGVRLTHLVEVEQEGNDFNGKDAENVMQAMRHFLTFAKGGACDLACPSGRNDSDEEVWARWSSPRQWKRAPLSWFDRKDVKPLSELFPGFMRRWTMDGWEGALRISLWWYVLANSSSHAIEQGIVSAQIAMERLAYQYCVRERKLVSEHGFEKLDAADRCRLMLSCLDIPLSIPSAAQAVVAVSKERDWRDSAQAVTEIRNKLVHSGRKEVKLAGEGYVEAWLLATWLLELTILALCDYKGEYWNRVMSTKEPVPWAY